MCLVACQVTYNWLLLCYLFVFNIITFVLQLRHVIITVIKIWIHKFYFGKYGVSTQLLYLCFVEKVNLKINQKYLCQVVYV